MEVNFHNNMQTLDDETILLMSANYTLHAVICNILIS
jgi:hypothetical protein